MNMKISVIIPTLNAEKELPVLLRALQAQKQHVDELIVVDSASDDRTVDICKSDPNIKLLHVERDSFDHGRTRDMALRKSTGEIVVFLTQDALPANDVFLTHLIAPISEDRVAVSTGRQIPKSDATLMEKYIREFNYPPKSSIRSKDDLPKMGIKTFFCSDVCAAYNREIYMKLGGFDYPIKTNEDMFFAAKAINAGYRIAYSADACVFHSHNLSLKEQYKRNYIQGYEIERHRNELNNTIQELEGLKLVRFVSRELLKKGRIGSFVHFGFDCVARLAGSRAGKRAYIKNVEKVEK